jgi:hypothetical protein
MRITVVETSEYRRKAKGLFSESEQRALIDDLSAAPESGSIMPETGGIRKLRRARQGMGKSGGGRVIYYYHDGSMPLYLLTIFGKNEKENLPNSNVMCSPSSSNSWLRHTRRRYERFF